MRFSNRFSPTSHAYCSDPLCLTCLHAEALVPVIGAVLSPERIDWVGGVREVSWAPTPQRRPQQVAADLAIWRAGEKRSA